MPKSLIPAISDEFLQRDGLTKEIALWEDALRTDLSRGTFEWWYFDAHFEDGSTVVIVFSTRPLLERKGPLKPNLQFTITDAQGVKHARFPIFAPEEFRTHRERPEVQLATHWLRGDLHRYEVHVDLGDLAADLIFEGVVPPWRPGAGKVYFGDFAHYFAWLPAIPFGTVSGTLRYAGQTHTVRGTGYHDHNWGNVDLNKVWDHWYWGRAHVGDYTLIFVEQVATPAYGRAKLPVFLLAKGREVLIGDGFPLRLETGEFMRHAEGRHYPLKVDFHWEKDGGSVHLALRQPQMIEATSLLLFFPAWQRRLLRLFGNPYYFRFQANLHLSIQLPQLQDEVNGEALYEIMMLR